MLLPARSCTSPTTAETKPEKRRRRSKPREKGGSGLRYSFDVQANGITYEVGIDAVTGRVLENGREGKNPD